jgi:hypothetical protein
MLVLSRQEREATLSVVDHLIEIYSLRVHQRRGHSSLYTYCINELGYSRRSAHLRIVAARTIRRWPRVRRLLEERRLTLSTLAAVSDSLTPDNYRALLNRVCGKSHQEVERILAELRGVRPARERISQITTVARGDSGVGTKLGLGRRGVAQAGDSPTTSDSQSTADKSITAAEFTSETRAPQTAAKTQDNTRRVERRYRYEFSGSEKFMRKYQKAASLLSNRLPAGVTIEAVFELLLDDYLERNDPAQREERRQARRVRVHKSSAGNGNSSGSGNGNNNGETSCGATGSVPVEPAESIGSAGSSGSAESTGSAGSAGATESRGSVGRRIPTALRDQIHVRDGGRCTFRSPGGERCEETQRLHIDHIVPWALGGASVPENLRLLCAGHNQLQADRHFGTEHVDRRRQE